VDCRREKKEGVIRGVGGGGPQWEGNKGKRVGDGS